jgi:hypothetical protein
MCLEVGATLLDKNNQPLHSHSLMIDVLPEPEPNLLRNKRVAILGKKDGRAWKLAGNLGARPRLYIPNEEFDLIIGDDPDMLRKHSSSFADYIHKGGRALFLNSEAGKSWEVGEKTIRTIKTQKRVHFVSRKTGHPVVDDFDKFDFFLWYNKDKGYIDHVCDKTALEGQGLTPITLTGRGIWYSERKELPAAAELRLGKGKIIFDQLRTYDFVPTEPRASIYLNNLIEYLQK